MRAVDLFRLCFLLLFLGLAVENRPATAYGPNDPVDACVKEKKGGPQPSGPLRSGSTAAQITCLTSYSFLDLQSLPILDQDFDLLFSGYFDNPRHPYMSDANLISFLKGLDDSLRQNEFHLNWKDIQLNFNYFHAADSVAYYGSPHAIAAPAARPSHAKKSRGNPIPNCMQ